MNLFSIWVELLFFYLTQRIETSFNMTQRIVFFFLSVTERIEPTFFWSMTQRIELTFVWIRLKESNEPIKNWTLFQKRMTQRIEISWARVKELNFWVFLSKKKKRLKELSFHQKYDTKNWTFFFNMTQRFFQCDSKNSTFLYNMTQRLGFFHQKKLKEFDFFWRLTDLNLFSKIVSKKKNDSKNWSLFLTMTLKMEFFFEVRTRLTELFFFFFSIRLTELNLFFLKMTQRITFGKGSKIF